MKFQFSKYNNAKSVLLEDSIEKNDGEKEFLTNQILPNQITLDDAVLLTKNETSDYVTAINEAQFFCVGIIDIVNSTKTVAKLNQTKSSRYYELFLNTMAKDLDQFMQ